MLTKLVPGAVQVSHSQDAMRRSAVILLRNGSDDEAHRDEIKGDQFRSNGGGILERLSEWRRLPWIGNYGSSAPYAQ
jgi:hypothetical protein